MFEARLYIEAMAKHLPPSASTLHLLDVNGASGAVLSSLRGDLHIARITDSPLGWNVPPDCIDAIVAFHQPVSSEFLTIAHSALRPGGRLVIAIPMERMSEVWVTILENAGYTRILVEPVLEGVLIRGEKPHTEPRTHDRIRQVASNDANLLDFTGYNGRYVHLLVRQTPNKPVWKLLPGEQVEWQAVAVEQDDTPALLAFSSLPKAVAFMQPAVMAGCIKDVNKVAKFSREMARHWTASVLLNPTMDSIGGGTIILLPVDPQTAEVPDE
jgi:hypothetical protein